MKKQNAVIIGKALYEENILIMGQSGINIQTTPKQLFQLLALLDSGVEQEIGARIYYEKEE